MGMRARGPQQGTPKRPGIRDTDRTDPLQNTGNVGHGRDRPAPEHQECGTWTGQTRSRNARNFSSDPAGMRITKRENQRDLGVFPELRANPAILGLSNALSLASSGGSPWDPSLGFIPGAAPSGISRAPTVGRILDSHHGNDPRFPAQEGS